MHGIYTLKNGKRITVFMWDDFLKNETWRQVADVRPINSDGYLCDKEAHKKLFKDDHGIYIVWDRQKVYLNDFDAPSVDELVAKIQNAINNDNRWPFSSDEIWATFMKHSDEIGIIADIAVYDMIVPGLGIAFTGSNSIETLCVPMFDDRYGKNELDYKIQFKCAIPSMEGIVSKETMYFSDFCSMILSGHIKLANLTTDRETLMQKYDRSQYSFENPFKKKGALGKLKDKFLGGDKKQTIVVPSVLDI